MVLQKNSLRRPDPTTTSLMATTTYLTHPMNPTFLCGQPLEVDFFKTCWAGLKIKNIAPDLVYGVKLDSIGIVITSCMLE